MVITSVSTTSLGEDCQIHATTAGFGNPAKADSRKAVLGQLCPCLFPTLEENYYDYINTTLEQATIGLNSM
jgi:hypothetical protein